MTEKAPPAPPTEADLERIATEFAAVLSLMTRNAQVMAAQLGEDWSALGFEDRAADAFVVATSLGHIKDRATATWADSATKVRAPALRRLGEVLLTIKR